MSTRLVNHIVLALDASGSMDRHADGVISMFNSEIDLLKKTSVAADQETRVSVYTFNYRTECLVFDTDVMRVKPLQNFGTSGQTALVRTLKQVIEEQQELPERYADHAFLLYVLTDGQDNMSDAFEKAALARKIQTLPTNWTAVGMVPTDKNKDSLVQLGFEATNVARWTLTAAGVEEIGETFRSSYDQYMKSRATGVRSSKDFFELGKASLTKKAVKANLAPLVCAAYATFTVDRVSDIKDFCERRNGMYKTGHAFYQLTKPEKVQASKEVLVRDRDNGTLYGGRNSRQLLGLPEGVEVKVHPGSTKKFDVFVQSKSVNRRLMPNTQLIYLY